MSQTKTIDLAELVETYTSELYSWASYKVSDSELAKDIVQDTFLAAAEKLKGFKGDSSVKTWLFSILNYKIIDVYRNKIRQPIGIEDLSLARFFDNDGNWLKTKTPKNWHNDEHNLLDNNDFLNVLNNCLTDLPEKWSLCVKLKYLSGKNGKEICQELNIAPTNFWQMAHRAKIQLRECIENNWFND